MNFEMFLEFCKGHWELLVEIGVSLIILIVSLVKRTKVKVVDSAFGQLLSKLPSFVNEAESSGLSGHDKYLLVLSRSVKFLALLLNRSEQEVVKDYAVTIDKAIEDILTTPQKKG